MSKKIQPDEVEYVDTTLIECSKLRSTEINKDSPELDDYAIFSNEQSVGIKVEEGDTISMSSAFISEVGAGGQVVEFTAKPAVSSNPKENVKYSVVSTKQTSTGVVAFTTGGFNPYVFEYPTNSISYLMNDYDLSKDVTSTTTTNHYDVVDNELHFSVSYYKCSNGENYFHLPRRWANGANYNDIVACYEFGCQDPVSLPAPGKVQGQDASIAFADYHNKTWLSWNDDTITDPAPRQFVPQYEASGQIVRDGGAPEIHQLARADNHRQFLVDDNYSTAGSTPMNMSRKNDNSKYKIYVRTQTTWYPSEETTAEYKTIIQSSNYDLAYNTYIPYLEEKKITVDRGFDTPANIATTLTEQLNQVTTDKAVNYKPFNDVNDTRPILGGLGNTSEMPYTRITETELFKTFRSATEATFNETPARRYFCGNTNTGGENGTDEYLFNQSTLNYLNSFHYIGVKRPEIYDAGHNFGSRIIQWSADLTTTRRTEMSFVTNIFWDETNPVTGNYYLTDFKALFDAQSLYPELFDYNKSADLSKLEGLSVDNTRYLHMQTKDRLPSPNENVLGNDNWILPADAGRETWSGAIPNGSCSSPLFLYFNKDQQNDLNVELDGSGPLKQWGGFAHRYKIEGIDYIAFANTGVDFWSDDIFDSNNKVEANARVFGYDRHWNAYGTSCIGLYSGKSFANYVDYEDGARYGDAVQAPLPHGTLTASETVAYTARQTQDRFCDLGGHIYYNGFDGFPFTYIGAPQPIINFDTQVNRFSIGGLYSPEHIGNFINAGLNFNKNPFSKSDSPEQEVYYINKQLKLNSFCPDMIPYRSQYTMTQTTSVVHDSWTPELVSPYNENLDRYVIFDKFSGVTWESFGPEQKHWLQNSMLGILGFDYNALNSKSPSSFQTSRSNNSTQPNTRGITTSALIQNSSILSRTYNSSNIALYNYLPPSAPGVGITATDRGIYTFKDYAPVIRTAREFSVQVPFIVENTSTAFVRATNLPKKTTRPYYLIRSDIIKQDNFVASQGNRLPVIGIVNKINGDSDFFSTETEGIEFTATKPYVINKITTSIHTPSGDFATVDENSAVIYKIKKKKKIITNLAELVIQQTQS